MEIAVIICAIIVVLMTIVNVIVYWKIDKLLKEHLKSFKEIAKEQE